MEENWYALYLVAKNKFPVKKAFRAMNIKLKSSTKRQKLILSEDDFELIIYLRESLTWVEIAKEFKVTPEYLSSLVIRYKKEKATKNPRKSVPSSIRSISTPLYHESRGVQVG